jgi:serine/threonine protein phosphatase PrpC
MNWTVQAATDVGRIRDSNEDAYLVDDGLRLAIVADGMGGHACGEVASRMATTLFRDAVVQSRGVLEAYDASGERNATAVRAVLRDAMRRCSKAVYDEAQRDPGKKGMGTTCSALVISGGTAFVAHVGDSRVYRIRDKRIAQVTNDHSLLDQLVRDGQLTESEAKSQAYACYRSALARAIGVEPDVEVDVIAVEALPGDVFVLASDGLTRYVHEEELAVEVVECDGRIDERLVEIANARGGADNVTVVVVTLPSAPAEETGPIRLDDKVRALRRGAIFRSMSYADILHVLSLARTRVVPPDGVILDAGQSGGAVYAVLSGTVRIVCDGEEVARLEAGEPFGSFSLAESSRSGQVVAAEKCRVLHLDRASVAEIARKSPEIGDRLLASMAPAS